MAQKNIVIKRIRIKKPIILKNEEERISLKEAIADAAGVPVASIEMTYEDKTYKGWNE